MQPARTSNAEEPDPYLVHPRSDLLDERTRVLKSGDTFAVFDRRGDAVPFQTSSHGLYHRGTRFLSCLALRVGGQRPILLGSTVRRDNALLTVDLANSEIVERGVSVPADTVHVFRSRFLREGHCYDRIRFTNHGSYPLEIAVSLAIGADFADIFEVRGATRARRGEISPAQTDGSELVLRYQGLDQVVRTTRVEFDPKPSHLTHSAVYYRLALAPKAEVELHLVVSCSVGSAGVRAPSTGHTQAFEQVCSALRVARDEGCEVRTSNELFNDWIERSVADLYMMITNTEYGPYPYAGVPWFNTIFGRDGLITGRETLWMNPNITRGVLCALAATQAEETSAADDAEPGKIVHEMRDGEMAALGEVPFGRYYGSVDATPLFVMLVRDYYARTGDRATTERLWPAVTHALAWIDRYGDNDGDGFLEYARHSRDGLIQQGWKDSRDSVFHDDGRLVEASVALCEVQGYAYAARVAGAELASLLGHLARAESLTRQAAELKARFAEKFWCEDLGMFALALDGEKRPCRVRSSNAGQCLFTGICEGPQAARTMAGMMDDAMFSGWGIRTLASTEARYNPMSYHNGSIWPHDNALIALGMARHGRKDLAVRVLEALFHASLFMDMYRMPELFCGFQRRQGEGPTLYPVACAPQAWAAGAAFLLLEACLGLTIDGPTATVALHEPALPSSVDWIEIKNLRVAGASIDLLLRRARTDVAIEVLDKRGDARVVITKTV